MTHFLIRLAVPYIKENFRLMGFNRCLIHIKMKSGYIQSVENFRIFFNVRSFENGTVGYV